MFVGDPGPKLPQNFLKYISFGRISIVTEKEQIVLVVIVILKYVLFKKKKMYIRMTRTAKYNCYSYEL